MTKKDSKQIIAMLKALQYLQSTFSDYPLKWEVTELDPEHMKMEVDCYFKTRAAQLLLLFDDFSTLSTNIEEEVLTIQ